MMNSSNGGTTMDQLDEKLLSLFPGKVVRKDIAQPLKNEFNVPAYVAEYLLGKYCSSRNEEVIEEGLKEVRRILTENYVRPDQSEVLKSWIKERGRYRVIDKVKAQLVETQDKYWAKLVNLQIDHVNIDKGFIQQYEKLLAGGIWAIVEISYNPDIFHMGMVRPFTIEKLRPIQLAIATLDEIEKKRQHFTTQEWIDVLLRSMGLEPAQFDKRTQLLILARIIPLIERNFNLVELGPRGTGKSYVYREPSPHTILVSGGETTVPSLFYSLSGRGHMGLVGLWDAVAFDEVAGLNKLSDSAAVQIMKDYMESGSFSRGREEHRAFASMIFLGNIQYDIETLVRTSHLFIPFPPEMRDLAFLDRFHIYLPGWEIPKMQPKHLTKHYGFVVDFLAEFLRQSRKKTLTKELDQYFDLGPALNKRDEKAVRRTVSGLLKLLHPDGKYQVSELEEYLQLALEMRRRVKEQLRKMGGVEYWNTEFSYQTKGERETIVKIPEEYEVAAVPSSIQPPGVVYSAGWDTENNRACLLRIEAQLMKGGGKIRTTGLVGKTMKENVRTAYDYIKAQATTLDVEKKLEEYDIHIQLVNLMQAKEAKQTGVAFFLSMLSALNERSLPVATVVIGDMSVKGNILPLDNTAESIQIIHENGGEKAILPSEAKNKLDLVPPPARRDLYMIFYGHALEAAEKAFPQITSKIRKPKSTTSTLSISHHTLQNFETKMREFIENKLKEVTGEKWWNRRIPPDVKQNCEDRKQKREASYPWMTKKEYPPICYADFTDYSKIILKGDNWKEAFKNTFQDTAWIKTKLREMEPIRNDIAHNREISEEDSQKLEINSKEILRCISE